MQIDAKNAAGGVQKRRKNHQKSVPGGRKIEENWGQGCLPDATKHENEQKSVDPLNSAVPFLSIFVENGSHDGGQNPSKIDKKSIKNLMFFLTGFWMHFGKDF